MIHYSDDPVAEVPPVGAIGFSVIDGRLGRAILWGQKRLAGDDSPWTHVWVVLSGGKIIEAEPGGAKIRPLSARVSKHRRWAWTDEPVVAEAKKAMLQVQAIAGDLTNPAAFVDYVEFSLRKQIDERARLYEGVPYGYLQYLAIGLNGWLDRHERESRLLRRIITNRGHMICSQLADQVLADVGIHVFDDGRLPQEVTPGDLAIHYGVR